MSKQIVAGLDELIREQVISPEVAEKIRTYYAAKKGNPVNRMLLAFGVIGALLIGVGVILLVAHNWDQLSRTVKTALSFAPLLIGQALCLFSLWKKNDSVPWRESSATFLVLAIGASISLVSQTYHVAGTMPSFFSSWLLLALPVVYLMRSSMASLMFFLGILCLSFCTWDSWSSPVLQMPFIFLVAILPHYILQCKRDPHNSFTLFHHWLVPLTTMNVLIGFLSVIWESYLIAIPGAALLSIFFMIGQLDYFAALKTRYNGYKVIGLLVSLWVLFFYSFGFVWEEFGLLPAMQNGSIPLANMVLIGSLIIAALLFLYNKVRYGKDKLHPIDFWFIPFGVMILLGQGAVLVNLLLLAIGIWCIIEGSKRMNLGNFNLGLLTIMLLVGLRFVEYDASFVVRGVVFITMGICFLCANIYITKG